MIGISEHHEQGKKKRTYHLSIFYPLYWALSWMQGMPMPKTYSLILIDITLWWADTCTGKLIAMQ